MGWLQKITSLLLQIKIAYLNGISLYLGYQMSHIKVGITWGNLNFQMTIHGSHQLLWWPWTLEDSKRMKESALVFLIIIQSNGIQYGLLGVLLLVWHHLWLQMLVLLERLKQHTIKKWRLQKNQEQKYYKIKSL